MRTEKFFLISCEHAGNRIPPPYRGLFAAYRSLLHTHRGRDFGALRMAREMSAALAAPLMQSTVSRLLIDLNRSPRHPRLYSEATRPAPREVRDEIFRRYYLPYRNAVESTAAKAIASGMQVIHLSCHSFTPELDGRLRNADIGLLYDPKRAAESDFCRRWRQALLARLPDLRIRMNYPYAGTADGFTVHLRRRFGEEAYLGIELEINQKHALGEAWAWRRLRSETIAALDSICRM